MTTRTAMRNLFAWLTLAWLFCISSTAQSTDQGKDPQTVKIGKEEVESLQPSWPARFARAFQYTYQFSEQPAFTAVALQSSTQIIPNPERYLNQHTLSFKFAELFPTTSSTSSLASIVAAIYNSDPHKTKKTIQLSGLCPAGNTIRCLASGGPFWERFLSGVSGDFALSERDEVQQGILLSNLPFSQHYGPAGEIDFDPASLFVTAASWNTVVTKLKGIAGIDGDSCFMKDANAPPDVKACVDAFAIPRFTAFRMQGTRARIATAFIPKFQFKVVDQFDFIRNGGVLISEPGLQRSLKNYTFTWDLSHVIPSTADRLAVREAYRSYASHPSDEDAGKPSKVCVTISGTSRGYVPVGEGFTADGCGRLAAGAGAGSFALACATNSNMMIGDPNNPGDTEPLPPESNPCHW
jgi:hypothetical protein